MKYRIIKITDTMRILGVWMLAVCISLCFAVVSSCTDDHNHNLDGNRVPAAFTPVISGEQSGTRVSGNDWQVSDRIGIYMLAYNKDELPGYEANRQYYASASGEKTTLLPAAPDQAIYYPVDGSKVKFVAYYPCHASIDVTDTDPVRPVDISDQSGEDVNLLACVSPGNYCIEEPNAKLEFEHQMSKVVVNITRATGVPDDLSDMTALFSGMPTTANYHISDQTFSDYDDIADITAHKTSGAADAVSFAAIIIPQPSSLGLEGRSMEFDLNGETYSYPISKHTPYENGKLYTYNLMFTGTAIIWTSTTVTEWLGEKFAWVGNERMSISVGELEFNSDAASDNLLVLYTENIDEDDLMIFISKSATTYDPENQPEVDWITIKSFLAKTGETGAYLIKFDVSKYQTGSGSSGGGSGESGSGGGTGSGSGGIGVGDWQNGSVIGRSVVHTNEIAIIDDYETYFRYTFGQEVLTRADEDTDRTAYLHITNGVVTIVVKITQTDISLSGVYKQPEANCYMMHPDGLGIAIPVGNRAGVTSGNYTYEVVWSDDANNVAVSTTSSIRYIATQSMSNEPYLVLFPGSAEGNAVVAVKQGDEIKWSWHIWTTAYNPYSHYPATLPDGTVVMDHNLGAVRAPGYPTIQPGEEKTNGLLYQWGRKDPFPKSATEAIKIELAPVSLTTAIQHPYTFYAGSADWNDTPSNELWNSGTGEKTTYDPCPVDWRVPVHGMWNELVYTNFLWDATLKGRSHTTAGWYPAAGYRNASGTITSEGTAGCYWAAGVNGTNAYRMYIDATNNANGVQLTGSANRALGYSVRCVKQ